jgi:hypothetical protein
MKPRYQLKKTDHHWDKCWGIFDTVERRWVAKDIYKRLLLKQWKELNAQVKNKTNHR